MPIALNHSVIYRTCWTAWFKPVYSAAIVYWAIVGWCFEVQETGPLASIKIYPFVKWSVSRHFVWLASEKANEEISGYISDLWLASVLMSYWGCFKLT